MSSLPLPPDAESTGWSRFHAMVPNAISGLRIAMAVAFPFVPAGWRAGVVIAGAVSDLADGLYSRLFRVRSTSGQILDPIADKMFVASVLVTLLLDRQLQIWQVLLVGFRDLAVMAGSGSVVLLKGWSALRQMPPNLVGKLTTAGQFAWIVSLLSCRPLALWLFWPTVVCSVLAGVLYLSRFRSHGDAPGIESRTR